MIAIFTASTQNGGAQRPAASAVCRELLPSAGLPGGLRHRSGSTSVAESFLYPWGLPRLLFLRCPWCRCFQLSTLPGLSGGDRYIVLSRRSVLSAGRMINLAREEDPLTAGSKRSCGCDCLRLKLSCQQGATANVRSEDIPLPPHGGIAARLLEIQQFPSLSVTSAPAEKRQEAAKPEKSDRHKKQHSGAGCAAEITMLYCSIASGSKGNCHFILGEHTAIAADAGTTPRILHKGLPK